MPAKKLSITMDEDTWTQVENRLEVKEENVSGTISRDLDRYYTSLERARKSLREQLSDDEIAAILDNLNGVWMSEPVSIGLLYANVEDGMDDGLAEKWKIDGKALVKKLKAMSFIESCALADAAERWWNRVANNEQPEYNEMLEDKRRAK